MTQTFIDPIRLFKANDPYYWELDNVPLQQLLNNDRYLKEKIEAIQNLGSLGRDSFTELKPFVEEVDNVVKVNPGRYQARINDTYDKTPIQKLKLLTSIANTDFRTYTNAGVFTSNDFDTLITKLQSISSADALSLNGLSERVLQWKVLNSDQSATTSLDGDLPVTGTQTEDKSPVVYTTDFNKIFTQAYGAFGDLSKLSSEFIKMWRGVARIATVDVSEELSISIPAFKDEDFRYKDENGNYQQITGSQVRIDLVFIYSHPIDTSSTAVMKYSNGVPQRITAPTLGLVKGAGVIFSKNSSNSVLPNANLASIDDEQNPQILAHVADQYNTDTGFKGLNIHGSFPSPEDLMNIAPNLIETLESTDPQLIGQSVLPICYVVVRKNASLNGAGSPVILSTDIIDIRPFFRTAELTYGERSGIAAASPSLSLANPAVGQFQLMNEISIVKTKLEQQINQTTTELPRVVGGGLVWGGTQFGPEGAIRLAAQYLNGVDPNNLPFTDAPTYPDWDLAEWWTIDAVADGQSTRGTLRNDRVNINRVGQNYTFDSGTGGTTIATAEKRMGSQWYNSLNGAFCIHWCKKEILINRLEVPWMFDYTVECQFVNCLPQSSRDTQAGHDYHQDEAGAAGIWVEKKSDRFIIYVGWIANTPETFNQSNQTTPLPKDDRNTFQHSGFFVRHSDMGLPTSNNMKINNTLGYKAPNIGVCTYPTVSFKITGYPSDYYFKNLNSSQSLIILK
jgi:hypothetical protein